MSRAQSLLRGYPDEALLEEVQRVAGLVDKPVLTRADFTKHSGIAASALARRFGNWHAVLEHAGLDHMYSGTDEEDVRRYRVRYLDEDLLEELRRVAELVEKPVLTMTSFRKHSRIDCTTFLARFGGWKTSLERAGLGWMYYYAAPEGTHVRYTDEALLEEVRRVAALVDDAVLTVTDFQRYSRISLATFKHRMGLWNTVLELAGVGHMFSGAVLAGHTAYASGGYPDEVLLAEVRRVAELVDKPVLAVQDFDRHSRIGFCTLLRRFGNWHATLERAGVGQMFRLTRARYTDEHLLDEVRRVAGIVGTPELKIGDFTKHSGIGAPTIRSRFGTWQAALERVGLTPARKVRARRGNPTHPKAT